MLTLMRYSMVFVLFCAVGCGDDDAASVGGQWCGGHAAKDRDDCRLNSKGQGIGYLLLEQSGGSLSGQACEKVGKDCYPITRGSISGNSASCRYEFSDPGQTSPTPVDLSLTFKEAVGDAAPTLEGSLKVGDRTEYLLFHRIP